MKINKYQNKFAQSKSYLVLSGMKTETFQININLLHEIIKRHERHIAYNSDASNTIEFQITCQSDTHLGSDECTIFIKSKYAECNSIPLTIKP